MAERVNFKRLHLRTVPNQIGNSSSDWQSDLLNYSDKFAHTQVVINCPYSVAHLCMSEATLAYNLGALHFDDLMSYNSLTTVMFTCLNFKMAY